MRSGNGSTASALADRYHAALERFAASPDEAGRLEAYELGRQALEEELGVLELSAAHRAALERLLANHSDAEPARVSRLGLEFFIEAIAPFEMSLRGFRTANLRLQSANEALARRTGELESARAEAESERATLAAVIASTGDGLLVLDGTGSVRLCNARAAELLRRSRDALLGIDVEELYRSLADGDAGEVLRTVLERTLPLPASREQVELELPGPPRRDLLLEVFPLATPEGDGAGVALRDLTAQRELDRAKDELVAVVSHELRSPLTAVCGFVELLLARPREPEQQKSYLRTILQEARRLGALIDDFLDLQRLDRGAGRIEPVPTDIGELLERLHRLSVDQGQPFLLELPDELPVVDADPERIWQVLLNLLGNARKYSPTGGEIRLSALASESELEVAVADEGLGIPAEALPRLFEDFYRVATPDRKEIPGTGLGLSICRKIVEAHGGRIWAESAGLGRGSRFSFTLRRRVMK